MHLPPAGVRPPTAAAAAIFALGVLLALDAFVPPLTKSYGGGRPVWVESAAGLLSRSWHGPWAWRADLLRLVLALFTGGALLALAGGVMTLSTRGRRFTVVAAAGALGAVAAVVVLTVMVQARLLGPVARAGDVWGVGAVASVIVAAALLLAVAGARVARTDSPGAGSALVAVAGLAAVGVAIAAVPGLHQQPAAELGVGTYPQSTVPTPSTAVTTPDSTPSTTAATVTPAGALTNDYTAELSEQGGYTETATLGIGAAEHLTPGLSEGGLTAGSACQVDSQTDAVIPAQLQLTNTSPNDFSARTGAGLSWSSDVISGVEAGFSNGPECEDSNGSFGMASTYALRSGTSSTTNLFIVVANYYTPDHPEGDESRLAGVTLTITGDTTDSLSWSVDSVTGKQAQTTSSGAQVPLDPAAQSAGQPFQITDAGATVYSGPTASSDQVATLSPGHDVAVVCVSQGDQVGNDSMWDKIASPAGYVADAYVNTNDGQGIPAC